MLIFLKLYLAHLLADFLLQSDRVARNKQKPSILLTHSATHVLTAYAVVFLTNLEWNFELAGVIALVAMIHALFDYLKARFSRDGVTAFSLDQLGHLLVVALAALWLSTGQWSGLREFLRWISNSRRLYLYLCAYVAVVFGGGYFVQRVTQYFMSKIEVDIAVLKPGLPNAGKYIGWLERSFILTLFIVGYAEAIGFLLAAKALARYPEIKEDPRGHFAEYFLIGTLTSVGLAVFGGLAVVKAEAYLPWK